MLGLKVANRSFGVPKSKAAPSYPRMLFHLLPLQLPIACLNRSLRPPLLLPRGFLANVTSTNHHSLRPLPLHYLRGFLGNVTSTTLHNHPLSRYQPCLPSTCSHPPLPLLCRPILTFPHQIILY